MKYRDLLLPFSEFINGRYEWPYSFSFSRGGQFISYVGFRHSTDPKDSQFNELQKKWNEFVQKTEDGKRIVFVERKTHNDYQETIEKAISKYGEAGAGMFLAKEISAELVRPEPDFKYEVENLLDKFSKEEIYYSYIAVGINQWIRFKPKENLEEYLQNGFIDYYSKELDWDNFNFSLEGVKKIHKEMFDEEFSVENEEFFARITNPINDNSVINKVIREKSTVRNLYILDQIEKYWSEGFSIFIIYGGAHAVMQEKAIQVITGN